MKKKSQNQYLSYLELAGDGIIITDKHHRVQYVNPKALEIMALGKQEVENEPLQKILEVYSEESLPIFDELIDRCVRKGESVGLVEGTTFSFPGGKRIFASASITPRVEDDEILEFIWVFRNITEVVRKDREAKEKNRELEIYYQIFQQAQNIILMIDLNGNVVKANPEAQRAYGYKEEELIGLNIQKIQRSPYVLSKIKDPDSVHQKLLRTTHTKKDGSTFPVDINSIYIDLDNERYLLGIIEDQSIREAQRKDLIQAKRKAERANQAKTEFLANMSHEIRTPISGIMGMTDLLLREREKLDRDQLENLKIIKSSSENLLNTMNDVLDFSKIEAGHLSLEKRGFDLAEVLTNLEKNYRSLAMKKGLKFSAQNYGEDSLKIYGDVNRLYQILNNLLTNAVKFTDQGEVRLEIHEIGRDDDRLSLQFSVIDTGRGISKPMIEQIFKPFTQENTTYNRDTGGVGLGLSITEKLCRAMGGRIGVFSDVNQGSHFWVALDFQLLKEVKKKNHIKKDYNSIKGIKVLVVEDFSVNQRMLKGFLKPYDIVIDLAENGKEAVEKYQKNRYDMILMDIQMPVMDGIQATEAIRRIEKKDNLMKTPIIALTAHAINGDRENFISYGMDDYISKPYRITELLEAMENQQNIIRSRSSLLEYLNAKEQKRLRHRENTPGEEKYPVINEKLREMKKAFSTMNQEHLEELGRELKAIGSEKNQGYLEDEAFRLMLCVRRQDFHHALAIFEELESRYR